MTATNSHQVCPRCGADLPASVPDGLCPCCVAGTVFEDALAVVGQTDWREARFFGDYELIEEIARGGMGIVFKARQLGVKRVVALKVLASGAAAGHDFIHRFHNEAEAAARLDHPNIVPIFEFGEHEGSHFLAMQHMEGGTLLARVAKERPSPRQAALWLLAVAQGVDHAHQRGVLHRDLKPGNVLLDREGVPRVSDFGLARMIEEDSSLTVSHAVLGTAAYLAPEVAVGGAGRATIASDIYGLGAILYEALTGRPPFLADSFPALLRSHAEETPAQPRSLNSAVSPDLETICLKCLEKEPLRRYATAGELADDLGRFLQGEPIAARPTSLASKAWRRCRRKPIVAGLAGALLVALALGLTGILWQWRRAEVNAATATRQQRRAEKEERTAQVNQYVSDMNLVQQAWADGNLRHAQDLLQAHLPKPGAPDLRGWEWRYLWALCQNESQLTLTNFPEPVRLVQSPDRRSVAAFGDHKIWLLDIEHNLALESFNDPGALLTALAFLPSATNIVVLGTGDGRILLLDLRTKQLLTESMFQGGRIDNLAFSPDGKFLASGHHDHLTLWDMTNRSIQWTNSTLTYATAPIFTADGKSLITGGGEIGNPISWDVMTGRSSPFPKELKGWVNSSYLSPDGATLATGGNDNTVVLWNVRNQSLRARLDAPAAALQFSADGRYLITGGFDSAIRVWDVSTAKQVRQLLGHQAEIRSVCFSSDGKSIISSSWDQTVKVWDREPRHRETILRGHEPWVPGMAFSPDSQRLYALDYHGRYAAVWDAHAATLITNLHGFAQGPVGLALAQDGTRLAVGCNDHTVRIWDTATFQHLHLLTNDFEAGSLSFSPDGQILAVAQLGLPSIENVTNSLTFWRFETGEKINRLPAAAARASCVAFAHRGDAVAVGYANGMVRLWDFNREALISEFTQHTSRARQLRFSSDDQLLASISQSDVAVYDLKSGVTLSMLTEHNSNITSLDFAPDAPTLLTASLDGTTKLWNLASGKAALTLKEPKWPVTYAVFAPNGETMATASVDGPVRLWQAPPLSEIQQNNSH